MSENKHTPKPWVFEYRSGDHPLNDQQGRGTNGLWAKNGGLILGDEQGWDGNFCYPDDADKNLIEAAPDLLEALEETLFIVKELSKTFRPLREEPCIKKAKAAIAKAKGENNERSNSN